VHAILQKLGLVFDKSAPNAIKSFEPDKQIKKVKSQEESKLEKETWIEHAKNTLHALDCYLIPRYCYVIKHFADYFGHEYHKFVNLIRCIIALHDLGKLNISWQEKAGWNCKVPLAHSGENVKGLPPHAPISAKALQPYLEDLFDEESLFKAFYLAIAHHHKPWANRHRRYKLISNFDEVVKKIWNIPKELVKAYESDGELDFIYLDIIDENETYRLYGLLSKLLRISDRLATGGVSYESMFYA
jgi:CRISPR-associated endonuclease/helicase Cas3